MSSTHLAPSSTNQLVIDTTMSLMEHEKHANQSLIDTIIALVEHTASDKLKLVDMNLIPLLEWAKDYAGRRFRYTQVVRILRSGGQLKESKHREMAENALEAGDCFILARAEVDWEGDWVHPQWKKAAIKRAEEQKRTASEELENRERVEQLLSRARDLCKTTVDDLRFSYSEDEGLDDGESPRVGASHPSLKCETKIEPSNLSRSPRCLTENVAESEVQPLSEMLVKSQGAMSNSVARAQAFSSTPQVFQRAVSAKQKRQPETPLQSDHHKRSRTDDSCNMVTSSNQAPSVPLPHALLPFDFRGLSKDAQFCLHNAMKIEKRSVNETLLELFQCNRPITINEAYFKEVSRTLPPCLNCSKRNVLCVWSSYRARCQHCCTHNQKCGFSDLFRWHRVCYQLPDHNPADIRKIFEQTPSNSDPFWYERALK
ncbi:hypothetical protein GGU10DRAFT_33338 [Lentinula aff. detonsa]|uniref:Uncharacterized protein n=1 Tax=Lentinula aff. detonsa TaxID=2804958 RepID=A0AA38KFK5_9AGAR|nr:hypothetical protein GGU10DRAFT_33338 [Lentinula aff. detonsa]